jgi:hypothetical protein
LHPIAGRTREKLCAFPLGPMLHSQILAARTLQFLPKRDGPKMS